MHKYLKPKPQFNDVTCKSSEVDMSACFLRKWVWSPSRWPSLCLSLLQWLYCVSYWYCLVVIFFFFTLLQLNYTIEQNQPYCFWCFWVTAFVDSYLLLDCMVVLFSKVSSCNPLMFDNSPSVVGSTFSL